MKTDIKTIEINGVKYVEAGSVSDLAPATNKDGLEYVIVRSRDSGCHAGYLFEQEDGCGQSQVVLKNSRRLWYWDGAASLSQLSQEGVNKPNNCKFPCTLPEIEVFGVCEIITATEKARKSIEAVPVWKK